MGTMRNEGPERPRAAVYAIVELERSFRGWKRLKAIGEFPQFAHT